MTDLKPCPFCGKTSFLELDYIAEDSENAPAADVAPVRHGRWIWADDGYCRCSECTQKAPVVRQYQDEPMTTMTNYCHYCGAKMDLEAQHE